MSQALSTERPCGCMTCYAKRLVDSTAGWNAANDLSFRYACERCGNKRCPHHTDHNLACTASNDPGQPGSAFL